MGEHDVIICYFSFGIPKLELCSLVKKKTNKQNKNIQLIPIVARAYWWKSINQCLPAGEWMEAINESTDTKEVEEIWTSVQLITGWLIKANEWDW